MEYHKAGSENCALKIHGVFSQTGTSLKAAAGLTRQKLSGGIVDRRFAST